MIASWSNKDLGSKEQKIDKIFSTKQSLVVLIRGCYFPLVYIIH